MFLINICCETLDDLNWLRVGSVFIFYFFLGGRGPVDTSVNQSLYYPTNAHNVKNVEFLKHIKTMEAAATCFGLQINHHQGATASA